MIAYFKLIRLPNVFTAFADIIAGYFIAAQFARSAVRWDAFALIAGASAALYLSGMAFNDIADREEDARVRPGRPIPSGAVSLRGAVGCALVLMVGGVLLAFAAGVPSLIVASVLAFAILGYDFIFKGTLAGPIALGVCRFSNVILGMSAVYGSGDTLFGLHNDSVYWTPLLFPAMASGLYGAGVTAFSAQEESGVERGAIVRGWVAVGFGFLFAVGVFSLTAANTFQSGTFFGFVPLGVLLYQHFSRTLALIRTGTPDAARGLVLAGVKGYCLLDAAMLLFFGGGRLVLASLVALFMLVPGGWLRKWLMQREA